jgi:hypothetical protein
MNRNLYRVHFPLTPFQRLYQYPRERKVNRGKLKESTGEAASHFTRFLPETQNVSSFEAQKWPTSIFGDILETSFMPLLRSL